jgi:hypothetical protein
MDDPIIEKKIWPRRITDACTKLMSNIDQHVGSKKKIKRQQKKLENGSRDIYNT